MMCPDSSIHTTRVFPPTYLLTNWAGLSAAQINQWANWDTSKRTGRRPALAKSPAETYSTPLEAKACLCSSSHRNSLRLVSLFWSGGFVCLLLWDICLVGFWLRFFAAVVVVLFLLSRIFTIPFTYYFKFTMSKYKRWMNGGNLCK